MRDTLHKFIIALLLLVIPAALAAAENIYGPVQIKVEKKKAKLNDSFTADDGQRAEITVVNGSRGKRATFVKIRLNGVLVVKKKDIGSADKKFTRAVTLNANNKIQIIVKGAGAGVRVLISAAKDEARGLFERVVGVGDSLTAGMQDNTLVEERQIWNYVSQITNQVGAEFVLPLIGEPGIPARSITLVNGVPAPLDPQPDGERINPDEENHNLATPGATMSDALRVRKRSSNKLFEIILGGGETMVERAEALKPTLIFFWLGSNELLPMAFSTDPDNHADIDAFRRDYDAALKRLSATGARIVAANIVDISAVPFLIEPPEELGLPPGSRITLIDFFEILLGGSPDLSDDNVLSPEELGRISATVDDFNEVISDLCAKYGATLLDVHALFGKLNRDGRNVAGHALNTVYLGGIFSLDGVHPTSTAQAILANEFIALLNKEFDQDIEPIDVEQVFMLDPLQTTGEETGVKRLQRAGPDALRSLRLALENMVNRIMHSFKKNGAPLRQ